MHKRIVATRSGVPWFNNEIKTAIKSRRKAERKWRRSRTAQDLQTFKSKTNHATYLMNAARQEYYANCIAEVANDQ